MGIHRSSLAAVLTGAALLLSAGCTGDSGTGPFGAEEPAFLADVQEDAKAEMELAVARYNLEPSQENLVAVRSAKEAYAFQRMRETAQEVVPTEVGGVNPMVAKAAVIEEGWGDNTEWTYSWTGSVVVDNATTVSFPMTVPGPGILLDVDVEITEILHPWTKDLIIHAISPAGTSSQLFFANPHAWDVDGLTTNPEPTLNIIGAYFDDEAEKNVSAWDDGALAPFTGSWQPFGFYWWGDGKQWESYFPLNLMDGEDISGEWTLTVEDIEAPDPGTVNGWKLILTIDGGGMPSGGVDATYGAFPRGIENASGYTWSIASGSLPDGLSIDPGSGLITGTPTAIGTSSFTVQGVLGEATATASLSITINPPLVTSAPTLQTGIVGTPYPDTQLTASGGGGNYVWSSGDLPPGMTLSPDGTLGGTPTTPDSYTFSATVTSDDGQTSTVFLGLLVEQPPLGITSSTPIPAVAGQSFDAVFEAAGGGGGYVWSFVSGSLPDGLTWSDGSITGTPQAEETTTFTLSVTSQDGQVVTKEFTIIVGDLNDPLTVDTPSTPDGERGVSYSTQLEASGADLNYAWSLAAGSELPPGLTLDADGTISGTPTVAGSYSFEVVVEAGYGQPVTATYTIDIVEPMLAIETTELPEGNLVGLEYPATPLEATGGNESYSWDIISGTFPPGLTLVDGVISGEPTAPGAYSFIVQVTSGEGAFAQTETREYTIELDYPTLEMVTDALHSGLTDFVYEPIHLEAEGGDGTYAWSLTAGTLPAGLTLVDGVISGKPQEPGYNRITLAVTSGASPYDQTVERDFAISIAYGDPLTVEQCANEGYVPFRFFTEDQCTRFVETGMDARAGEYPPLAIDPFTVDQGQTTLPWSMIFSATGGADDGPDSYYEWTSENLPEWATLDINTGEVSGTPLVAGDYSFDVTVTSFRDEQVATAPVTVPVMWSDPTATAQCTAGSHVYYGFVTETQCIRYVDTGMDSRAGEYPELTITTEAVPNGRPDEPYEVTFTATGGEDNPDSYYVWSIDNLPAGLTFDPSTGQIMGAPTADGEYTFTITVVSYGDMQEAFRTFTLKVTTDPETKKDCKKGGWADYGFENQGLCIQFVNTGFDSRLGEPSVTKGNKPGNKNKKKKGG